MEHLGMARDISKYLSTLEVYHLQTYLAENSWVRMDNRMDNPRGVIFRDKISLCVQFELLMII